MRRADKPLPLGWVNRRVRGARHAPHQDNNEKINKNNQIIKHEGDDGARPAVAKLVVPVPGYLLSPETVM
jgi:hypothetical protein